MTPDRISAGDWSLFTARRVAQERGGEIRVYSQIGKGTTFVVSLPTSSNGSDGVAVSRRQP